MTGFAYSGRMSVDPRPTLNSLLALEYPQSLAVYDTYAEAQRAVDFLADKDFAVDNLCIVGTDLKTVERVTGRRTWGNVVGGGASSGMMMGLFVGLVMSMFTQSGGKLAMILVTAAFGIIFGMLWAALGYALTRGRRDFNSIRQTVASRYEVLGEHKVAAQARELLATMPGSRAKLFEG